MKFFGMDFKDYVSKQIRFSIGNVPSIPLGLFITYAFTQWGGLWYIYSSLISWVVSTGINFNIQRALGVVVIKGKRDYLSKLGRFYVGSIPLVPLGTGVLYLFTQSGLWYIFSSVISMIFTTITGMIIQVGLRVVKVKDVQT